MAYWSDTKSPPTDGPNSSENPPSGQSEGCTDRTPRRTVWASTRSWARWQVLLAPGKKRRLEAAPALWHLLRQWQPANQGSGPDTPWSRWTISLSWRRPTPSSTRKRRRWRKPWWHNSSVASECRWELHSAKTVTSSLVLCWMCCNDWERARRATPPCTRSRTALWSGI
jgi:hypothetical protein